VTTEFYIFIWEKRVGSAECSPLFSILKKKEKTWKMEGRRDRAEWARGHRLTANWLSQEAFSGTR
jgi:hypothetical protein